MRFTINKKCFCGCNWTELDPHEPYGGRNRQLSIKYGMVIAICRPQHDYIHRNPKCDIAIKSREFVREYFEKNNPELDFIQIFK